MSMRKDRVNEKVGAYLLALFAVCFIVFLSYTLPPTMEGLSYTSAVQDALGLRVVKLALFDIHAIGVLYFYGGRSWDIVHTFKLKPISTALLLAAIFIGSALMLM
jgi:hypothetical protein